MLGVLIRSFDWRLTATQLPAAVQVLLALVIAGLVLSGCGASDAAGWHSRWGGSLEDYEVIFDESDCGELEKLIEETVLEITRTSLTEDRLERSSIIQAAFHRMVRLDCAEAYRQ